MEPATEISPDWLKTIQKHHYDLMVDAYKTAARNNYHIVVWQAQEYDIQFIHQVIQYLSPKFENIS